MTRTLRLIIGSYTDSLPHVQARGDGISFVDLDTESGRFTPVAVHPDIRNPSYLTLDRGLLYAVEELGADEATLAVFACDVAAARLTQRAKVPAHGAWPCHIGLDPGGTRLFLSNYLDGSFVTWPLDGERLPHGTPTVLRRTGRGPNPDRQDGPHTHFALASPDGAHVWICDAGTDEIVRHELTGRDAVAATPDLVLRAPPGSLPRHMTLSRDGARLFVVSELGNLVSTWRFGASSPELLGHVPTLAPGHADPSSSAAIRLHPEGRFLYSSNRGDDSIAVFDTATGTGLPVFLGTVPTGGRTPREFAISDDGRTMIVAHQDSHSLTALRIDTATGALSHLGGPFTIGSPVCVAVCPPSRRRHRHGSSPERSGVSHFPCPAVPPCQRTAAHGSGGGRPPGSRRTVAEREPQAEADQRAGEHPFLQAPDEWVPRHPSAERSAEARIGEVEDKAGGDEDCPQHQELRRDAAVIGADELRQQHRTEQKRLGVEQVGEKAAAQGRAPRSARFPRRQAARVVPQVARAEHPDADPDEIGGTGETYDIEQRRCRLQQRGEADRRKTDMYRAGCSKSCRHREGMRPSPDRARLQDQHHVGAGNEIGKAERAGEDPEATHDSLPPSS